MRQVDGTVAATRLPPSVPVIAIVRAAPGISQPPSRCSEPSSSARAVDLEVGVERSPVERPVQRSADRDVVGPARARQRGGPDLVVVGVEAAAAQPRPVAVAGEAALERVQRGVDRHVRDAPAAAARAVTGNGRGRPATGRRDAGTTARPGSRRPAARRSSCRPRRASRGTSRRGRGRTGPSGTCCGPRRRS